MVLIITLQLNFILSFHRLSGEDMDWITNEKPMKKHWVWSQWAPKKPLGASKSQMEDSSYHKSTHLTLMTHPIIWSIKRWASFSCTGNWLKVLSPLVIVIVHFAFLKMLLACCEEKHVLLCFTFRWKELWNECKMKILVFLFAQWKVSCQKYLQSSQVIYIS
jgi:hypothetical protein